MAVRLRRSRHTYSSAHFFELLFKKLIQFFQNSRCEVFRTKLEFQTLFQYSVSVCVLSQLSETSCYGDSASNFLHMA